MFGDYLEHFLKITILKHLWAESSVQKTIWEIFMGLTFLGSKITILEVLRWTLMSVKFFKKLN